MTRQVAESHHDSMLYIKGALAMMLNTVTVSAAVTIWVDHRLCCDAGIGAQIDMLDDLLPIFGNVFGHTNVVNQAFPTRQKNAVRLIVDVLIHKMRDEFCYWPNVCAASIVWA